MTGKLLNLDELIPENAYVILDGEKHEILAQSVETWLALMGMRDKVMKMQDATEDDAADMVRLQVQIGHMACPSLSEERLAKLPLSALAKLIELIGEQMTAGTVAKTEAGAETPEGEEAKAGDQ